MAVPHTKTWKSGCFPLGISARTSQARYIIKNSLAGILTSPATNLPRLKHPVAFSVIAFTMGLQQRACPGFSPDSLLFLVPDDNKKTSMEQRYEKNEMLIQVFLLF